MVGHLTCLTNLAQCPIEESHERESLEESHENSIYLFIF